MHALDEEFLTTRQEPRRLRIALFRAFESGDVPPDIRKRYLDFLGERIRAAVLAAVREGRISWVDGLLSEENPNDALCREAACLAAELGKTEIVALFFAHRSEKERP